MMDSIFPNPDDPRLTKPVEGFDQDGGAVTADVVYERPLSLYLNSQEIVTLMTIGDHPELLALGYLLNQRMIDLDSKIDGIDYDEEIETVVVRTAQDTDVSDQLEQRTVTSGCAQGTVFGNVMDGFDAVSFDDATAISADNITELLNKTNTMPSLYLKAGAIHGAALCEGDQVLVYMEDVGRHNAVDKVAGWMQQNAVDPKGKLFYTTGRLTSEMVIKSAMMGISTVVSRSGFTAWGVELAQQVGMTLIGRARGKRFLVLSGAERVKFRDTKS